MTDPLPILQPCGCVVGEGHRCLPAWAEPEIPTRSVVNVVHALIAAGMGVSAARATDPDAFPKIPADAGPGYWTRKVFAALAEAGYRPDGWETLFMVGGN